MILSQIQSLNSRSGTRSRRKSSASLPVADKVSTYVEMRQGWVKEQEKVRYAEFENGNTLLTPGFHSVYKKSKSLSVRDNKDISLPIPTNEKRRRTSWMSASCFLARSLILPACIHFYLTPVSASCFEILMSGRTRRSLASGMGVGG